LLPLARAIAGYPRAALEDFVTVESLALAIFSQFLVSAVMGFLLGLLYGRVDTARPWLESLLVFNPFSVTAGYYLFFVSRPGEPPEFYGMRFFLLLILISLCLLVPIFRLGIAISARQRTFS
jgi:hypothetical protein